MIHKFVFLLTAIMFSFDVMAFDTFSRFGAAEDPRIDNVFNKVGTGFNGNVSAIAVQSDNKIIAAGTFSSYNGTTANRIVRLKTDGSIDSGFSSGVGLNGIVYAIAIQGDGKIVIGGSFTSYNGITKSNIARLNIDGSLDTSYTVIVDNIIYALKLQSDGKILAGGSFSTCNNSFATKVCRINSTGTVDTTFKTTTNGTIRSIYIQSDSNIIIAGEFTSVDSFPAYSRKYIARILSSTGLNDTSFNTEGTGLNNFVRSIAIQSDGKIVAGGDFTLYNGASAERLIRFNANGTRDTNYVSGTGFSSLVYSLAIQSDGKIIAGGDFTSFGNAPSNRIVRLNIDGSKDSTFQIGKGFNWTINPNCVFIRQDKKIAVGGFFNNFNRLSRNGIIVLNK